MLRNLKIKGCWAFVDGKFVIHWWARKNCSFRALVDMFAHEFGHILRPYHRDQMAEEVKADAYANAACFAYDMAKRTKA